MSALRTHERRNNNENIARAFFSPRFYSYSYFFLVFERVLAAAAAAAARCPPVAFTLSPPRVSIILLLLRI